MKVYKIDTRWSSCPLEFHQVVSGKIREYEYGKYSLMRFKNVGLYVESRGGARLVE